MTTRSNSSRERILACAEAIVLQKGFNATSIEDILKQAQRANPEEVTVTEIPLPESEKTEHGTLYWFSPSRDESSWETPAGWQA